MVTGSILNVCACNIGTTGPDGFATCLSCAFGTYKTAPGSASCTGCGAGKFSAVTGSVVNVCACYAGSTGPEGFAGCSLCALGTYKTYPGLASCIGCEAGKFSAVTGSISKVCACNAGSTGSEGFATSPASFSFPERATLDQLDSTGFLQGMFIFFLFMKSLSPATKNVANTRSASRLPWCVI